MRIPRSWLLACMLVHTPVMAQQVAAEAPKSLQIVRTLTPPALDGVLDEPLWADAAKIGDLYQVKPGNGMPASERTEVYLAYDDNAIYVGAKLWDPASPNGIAATNMKHGAGMRDDDRIAVLFDTFNTHRTGYRFETNANGVRHDMLVNGSVNNADWTAIWEVAARAYEGYWIAEFAIPFKSLPFDAHSDAWGLNISRAIRRKGEESAWVTRDRTWNAGITGTMSGLSGMKQGVGLDVVPGLTIATRSDHATDTRKSSVEPSLDAYYRLTPSLNASLTFNTDFSATEVDDRQVNLGRFSLFFPEKRDFFLNDAEQFEFGRISGSNNGNNNDVFGRPSQENGRPFFSRRLGLGPGGAPADIQYGAKLSGRAGRWSIGALAIQQGASTLTSGGTLKPDLALVARLSANVMAESTIGGILTSGNTVSSDRNSLVGFDFNYKNSRVNDNHTVTGELWLQKSQSGNLRGKDAAFGAGLSFPNVSGWRAGLNVRELQENFNPALGYVNIAGVRQYALDAGYNGYPSEGRIHTWYAGVDFFRLDDTVRGGLLSQTLNYRLVLANALEDAAGVAVASLRESVYQPFTLYRDGTQSVTVPAGSYRYSHLELFLNTGRARSLIGSISFSRGGFYDGRYTDVNAQLTWKQSRHFTLGLNTDWDHIALPSGTFISRLVRISTEVGFTVRTGWTSSVQYDNNSEVLGFQSRLYWVPKAGQKLTLVLNHAMQDLDRDRHFEPTVTELSARASYTFRY